MYMYVKGRKSGNGLTHTHTHPNIDVRKYVYTGVRLVVIVSIYSMYRKSGRGLLL